MPNPHRWWTHSIQIKEIVVRIDMGEEYMETIFPCGHKVPASPDDVSWQDCMDHEIGHTWLAIMVKRQRWSPTLFRMAHPQFKDHAGYLSGGIILPNDRQVAHEEADVFAFQATLRGKRPWEHIWMVEKG